MQRKAITRKIDRSLLHEDEDTKIIKEEIKKDQMLSSRLILITLTTWSLYPITWLIEETDIIDKAAADIIHSVFAGILLFLFNYLLFSIFNSLL